jgi:transposase-like protein
LEPKIILRYSLAFKLKVVSEIEQGKYSIEESRRLYDIGGKTTIQRWLRHHGLRHQENTIVEIRMKDETEKMQQLQQRIAQLERAVAASQVEKICLQGLIDVLEEQYGEELKKNIEQLPSSDREIVRRLRGC